METTQFEKDYHARKRRAFWRRILVIVAVIAGFSALSGLWLSHSMRPALRAFAEARIQSVAARAMNDAILEAMAQEDTYDHLVSVHENGDKVYMLQADTRSMNILAADCANAAQTRIADMGEQGIVVPLGTITGISFLSGKGPGIRVSFTPAGSVQSEFSSELVSSGINQSLYRVNLTLNAYVQLVLPGVTSTLQVRAEAPISESIIVGDVPQVYTNVPTTDDMLNFVPTPDVIN
jgi:sporulation protein YunB